MSNIIPLRDELFFPIEQTFDRFFNEFFSKSNPVSKMKSAGGYPKMNAWYNDDTNQFGIMFAVPGMKADDLEVEMDTNRTLTVRGKMSSEYHPPNGSNFYIRELKQSYFERSVVCPDFIDGDPKTSIKDGILTLTWTMKKDPGPEGVRKISIKSD